MRSRLTLLLAAVMLLALPVATAMAAPKSRVKFQNKNTVVAENAADGLGHVSVRRMKRLSETVTVDYTTSSTIATAGTACGGDVDYIATSGTLTFGPGETNKEFTVPVCDDLALESAEFVDLALRNPSAGTIATNPRARLVIADNDGPARVAFADVDFPGFENLGAVTVTAIRLGDPNPAVSVDFASSDGSAVAGSDYNAAAGTLNFPGIAADPAGSALQTFTVTPINDGSPESDETVNLALSNPRDTAGGTPLTAGDPIAAVVTILDDDSPATIGFAPDSPANVSEKAGTLSVILRRSGAPGDTVTASYATSDGTALAGSDYTSTVFDSTDLTQDPLFDPEETEVLFQVPITDDAAVEGPENFGLSLSALRSSSGPVNPSPRPSMTVTIDDDDGLVAGPPLSSGGACELTLKYSKRQKVFAIKGVRMGIVAKRPCTVKLRATIKKGRRSGIKRTLRTKLVTVTLTPGRTANVKLRLSRKQLAAVKASLKARKKVSASIGLSSVDSTGRTSKRTVAVQLRR